jgi:hypothetical protein
MIRHALGATDLGVEGLNARKAFEIDGGVIAFIAWKLSFTSYFEGQRFRDKIAYQPDSGTNAGFATQCRVNEVL